MRFGEGLLFCYLLCLALWLPAIIADAVRSALQAPVLEWLAVAILYGAPLLFLPVYPLLLAAHRLVPKRYRRALRPGGRRRPILALGLCMFSLGFWFSLLVFVRFAHTLTRVHLHDCSHIPLDYPEPFLWYQKGDYHTCIAKPLRSGVMLLWVGIPVGMLLTGWSLLILGVVRTVRDLCDWLRPRGRSGR